MKSLLGAIILIFFMGCKENNSTELFDNEYFIDLYHRCDSVVRKSDTIQVFNSRFDTIVTETGIFAYLQYDYPLSTPNDLILLSKEAVLLEQKGETEQAENKYREMIDYYNTKVINQYSEFTCTNDLLQFSVNTSILCSYAYDRLGLLDKSIEVISPFLANVESWSSKIHELFLSQNVKLHGSDKVTEELKSCHHTICKKNYIASEYEDWVVRVFNSEIGVGSSLNYDTITSINAKKILNKYKFYKDFVDVQ